MRDTDASYRIERSTYDTWLIERRANDQSPWIKAHETTNRTRAEGVVEYLRAQDRKGGTR